LFDLVHQQKNSVQIVSSGYVNGFEKDATHDFAHASVIVVEANSLKQADESVRENHTKARQPHWETVHIK